MAFAASLGKITSSTKQQRVVRQEAAKKWSDYESRLLDEALTLFRQRCSREAALRRSQLTASFEVLSRDIKDFPAHVVKDSTYVVSSWGNSDVTPQCWFYATHDDKISYPEGAPVLFAEMLEGMMPKFLDKLKPLGFTTCGRETGSWKVTVSWKARGKTGEDEHDDNDKDCFAKELRDTVESKSAEEQKKQGVAGKWKDHESALLDAGVELFKQRCRREAEQQRCEAAISFEVLSREMADFPKRVIKDGSYLVESWGGDTDAESWFHATHGTNANFNEADPVQLADVLESMMPKLVKRLGDLGFSKCNRLPGTWKVSVAWPDPDGQAPAKRAKH